MPHDKVILAADDEKHMLRLLEFNLAKLGCPVRKAASGDEVLRIATTEKIDLLVIDVMMPGKDGFATIRELRADPAYRDLPVIMLTGRGQSSTRDEAKELGVSVYLTKPFSPIELQSQVRRLLGLT